MSKGQEKESQAKIKMYMIMTDSMANEGRLSPLTMEVIKITEIIIRFKALHRSIQWHKPLYNYISEGCHCIVLLVILIFFYTKGLGSSGTFVKFLSFQLIFLYSICTFLCYLKILKAKLEHKFLLCSDKEPNNQHIFTNFCEILLLLFFLQLNYVNPYKNLGRPLIWFTFLQGWIA